MLQVLADDSKPINITWAVAIVKRWLSSDYFLDGMSRTQLALSACLEAGWLDGRARDGQLHGHAPALDCSRLIVIRRPFGRIVFGSGVRQVWKVREGHR